MIIKDLLIRERKRVVFRVRPYCLQGLHEGLERAIVCSGDRTQWRLYRLRARLTRTLCRANGKRSSRRLKPQQFSVEGRAHIKRRQMAARTICKLFSKSKSIENINTQLKSLKSKTISEDNYANSQRFSNKLSNYWAINKCRRENRRSVPPYRVIAPCPRSTSYRPRSDHRSHPSVERGYQCGLSGAISGNHR